VHDLLSGLIPIMSFIRTLADAYLAIDAQVFVSFNAKLMVVFVDGLKKQDWYLFTFVAKKVISQSR